MLHTAHAIFPNTELHVAHLFSPAQHSAYTLRCSPSQPGKLPSSLNVPCPLTTTVALLLPLPSLHQNLPTRRQGSQPVTRSTSSPGQSSHQTLCASL